MMFDIITQKAITTIIEFALSAIENKLTEVTSTDGKVIVTVDPRAVKDSLRYHLEMISNWAPNISFKDLRKTKLLLDCFVDLDLTLGIKPTRITTSIARRLHVSELIERDENVVILGDPGAGKTTSLKRLALAIIPSQTNNTYQRTPVFIRLRDLKDTPLLDYILSTLGIRLNFKDDKNIKPEDIKKVKFQVAGQYLANLKALLLLDGLDEVPYDLRNAIIEDLRELFLHSTNYQIILTCRTADFVYAFENSLVMSIEPLSDKQILQFVDKWVGTKNGKDLLSKIRATPYGGSEIVPLTLAHLCAIYERFGAIPEKPKTVYRKIIRLLLEEWDEQRSINRKSRFEEFDTDKKEEFLKAIAYQLTIGVGGTSFDYEELNLAYDFIYLDFELNKSESKKVIQEIEAHTGLLLEYSSGKYEFVHKSIQEYLASEYILRLPSIPEVDIVYKLPNEMALAIALSSDPSAYYLSIVNVIRERNHSGNINFIPPFIQRIITEKVSFKPSLYLGWATAILYSLACSPMSASYSFSQEANVEVFKSFFLNEQIQNSIHILRDRVRVTETINNQYRITPIANREFAPVQTSSIILDDNFLKYAGWK